MPLQSLNCYNCNGQSMGTLNLRYNSQDSPLCPLCGSDFVEVSSVEDQHFPPFMRGESISMLSGALRQNLPNFQSVPNATPGPTSNSATAASGATFGSHGSSALPQPRTTLDSSSDGFVTYPSEPNPQGSSLPLPFPPRAQVHVAATAIPLAPFDLMGPSLNAALGDESRRILEMVMGIPGVWEDSGRGQGPDPEAVDWERILEEGRRRVKPERAEGVAEGKEGEAEGREMKDIKGERGEEEEGGMKEAEAKEEENEEEKKEEQNDDKRAETDVMKGITIAASGLSVKNGATPIVSTDASDAPAVLDPDAGLPEFNLSLKGSASNGPSSDETDDALDRSLDERKTENGKPTDAADAVISEVLASSSSVEHAEGRGKEEEGVSERGIGRSGGKDEEKEESMESGVNRRGEEEGEGEEGGEAEAKTQAHGEEEVEGRGRKREREQEGGQGRKGTQGEEDTETKRGDLAMDEGTPSRPRPFSAAVAPTDPTSMDAPLPSFSSSSAVASSSAAPSTESEALRSRLARCAGGDTCSVCLDSFRGGEEVIELKCGHCFYEPCVARWLRLGHASCPVCRTSLDPNRADEDSNPLFTGRPSNAFGNGAGFSRGVPAPRFEEFFSAMLPFPPSAAGAPMMPGPLPGFAGVIAGVIPGGIIPGIPGVAAFPPIRGMMAGLPDFQGGFPTVPGLQRIIPGVSGIPGVRHIHVDMRIGHRQVPQASMATPPAAPNMTEAVPAAAAAVDGAEATRESSEIPESVNGQPSMPEEEGTAVSGSTAVLATSAAVEIDLLPVASEATASAEEGARDVDVEMVETNGGESTSAEVTIAESQAPRVQAEEEKEEEEEEKERLPEHQITEERQMAAAFESTNRTDNRSEGLRDGEDAAVSMDLSRSASEPSSGSEGPGETGVSGAPGGGGGGGVNDERGERQSAGQGSGGQGDDNPLASVAKLMLRGVGAVLGGLYGGVQRQRNSRSDDGSGPSLERESSSQP